MAPPSRGGAPWGRIALFGCLGLFILGILLAVGGFFLYWNLKAGGDEITQQYIEERQGAAGTAPAATSGESGGDRVGQLTPEQLEFLRDATEGETGISDGDTTIPGRGTEGAGQPAQIRGSLGSGDLVRNDGTYYDEITIDMSSGDGFAVTLRSAAFDAYLTLYSPSGVEYSDDDGAGGSDARVQIGDGEPGPWRIWANAYRVGETGPYTMTIGPYRSR